MEKVTNTVLIKINTLAYEACDRTPILSHTKVSKACDKPHAIICKKGSEACGISHASCGDKYLRYHCVVLLN